MKATRILLIFLVHVFVHPIASVVAEDDQSPKPIMVSERSGWRQKVADKSTIIQRTDDGGQHWRDVTPTALVRTAGEGRPTDLAALNSDEAWVAIAEDPDADQGTVWIEHTSDGGKTWEQKEAHHVLQNDIKLSFVNNHDGFMLGLSGPATGSMSKEVYRTKDGGEHWELMAVQGNFAQKRATYRAEDGSEHWKQPSELPALGCYPTGIGFRTPLVGWVTATYHGGDAAPLYRTEDGGVTWKLQKLILPGNDRDAYANVYPPVFVGPDRQRGYLPVKYVDHRDKRSAWFSYETEDGGESWHPPVAGIPFYKED